MNYKYSCVVDAIGFYVAFVFVMLEQNDSGETEENIQYYTLKDGESLLDVPAPSEHIKPCWNGEEWVEGATPEEIAEWEREHPTPPLPEPSPVEVLREESRQMIVDKDLEIIELRRMLTDLDLTVRGGDSSGQIAD